MSRLRRIDWPIIGVICLGLFGVVLLARQPRSAGGGAAGGFPVTVTDARSRPVRIPRLPQRIVTLSPGAAETVFAVGAGGRVVADTADCRYPPGAVKLPQVDPADAQAILARKPDLVLGEADTPAPLVANLEARGVPVVLVQAATLREVIANVRLVGAAVGAPDTAARLADRLEMRRAAVEARMAGLTAAQRFPTLVLTSPRRLTAAGAGTFVDEMIVTAGGTNAAAKHGTGRPNVTPNTLAQANPTILVVCRGTGTAPLDPFTALDTLRRQPGLAQLAAVTNGRVSVLDDDMLITPGPRLIDGLEAMMNAIHPGLLPAEEEQAQSQPARPPPGH